jgi:hypothetical protein
MTIKRVFGEPVEKNGITIIPTANVLGGGRRRLAHRYWRPDGGRQQRLIWRS